MTFSTIQANVMEYEEKVVTIVILTLLVPSASSVLSLKIASADWHRLHPDLHEICNDLWQTRKSLKYESFDLP